MDILLQNLFTDIEEQRINLDNFNKELLENLGKTNEDVVNELQKMMGELQEAPKPVISFLQNVVSKPFNPFSS